MGSRVAFVLALALSAPSAGCTDAIVFSPASAADVRAAGDAVVDASMESVRFRDAHGRERVVDEITPVRLHETTDRPLANAIRLPGDAPSYEIMLGGLVVQCRPREGAGWCPLGDDTIRWELGERTRVVDGHAILVDTVVVALLGGVVVGNVACFGTSACGDSGRVTLGVAEGVLGVAAVVTLVAFVSVLGHAFR